MIASIILALHLLNVLPLGDAIIVLYLLGALFVIADLFVISLGLLAFNGLLAIYVAYVLQSGDNIIFGVPIDWPFVFGISFVEAALLIVAIYLFIKAKNKPVTTGTESMIGQEATVIEWKEKTGKVSIQGETWKAKSDTALSLSKDDSVEIEAIENLSLKIKPK